MKIILKLIVLQALLIKVAHVHICENESFVQTVVKKAKIKASNGDWMDCKADPVNPSAMIMAYAICKPDEEDAGTGCYQLHIVKFK